MDPRKRARLISVVPQAASDIAVMMQRMAAMLFNNRFFMFSTPIYNVNIGIVFAVSIGRNSRSGAELFQRVSTVHDQDHSFPAKADQAVFPRFLRAGSKNICFGGNSPV